MGNSRSIDLSKNLRIELLDENHLLFQDLRI